MSKAESCFLLETSILFYVHGSINSEGATFNAYSAIESSMSNDTYIAEGNVPTIVRVVYLSPVPLIDPSSVSQEPGTPSAGSTSDNSSNETNAKSVSGWAIGVGVAAVAGVLVSFVTWSYMRRNRQGRHVYFQESIGMPSASAVGDDLSVA